MEIINAIQTLPWNKNPNVRWRQRKESQIKKITVHQALGVKTAANCNAYHISTDDHTFKGVGAPHICYTYFINYPDGTIYQCNDLTDITAHVANQNTQCVGICLGGWFDYGNVKCRDGNPTKAQLNSLNELLLFLTKKLTINKTAVYTHDELQGKPSCPGIAAAAFVKKFKS